MTTRPKTAILHNGAIKQARATWRQPNAMAGPCKKAPPVELRRQGSYGNAAGRKPGSRRVGEKGTALR